jgi:transposase
MAAGTGGAYQDRSGVAGPDPRQGPSGGQGCVTQNGPPSRGPSRGGWTTQIPRVAADARTARAFALSPAEASGAGEGRALPGGIGPWPVALSLIRDRADEDNATRPLALEFGWIPVLPPQSNRPTPWPSDKALDRRRNQSERLFRPLKGFRRLSSRLDKLAVLLLAFLHFALLVEALREC